MLLILPVRQKVEAAFHKIFQQCDNMQKAIGGTLLTDPTNFGRSIAKSLYHSQSLPKLRDGTAHYCLPYLLIWWRHDHKNILIKKMLMKFVTLIIFAQKLPHYKSYSSFSLSYLSPGSYHIISHIPSFNLNYVSQQGWNFKIENLV